MLLPPFPPARALGALVPLLGSTPALLAQERVQAPMVRLPEGIAAPVIDGRLDDEAWQLAGQLGELTQVVPVSGSLPSEGTEVRLLYDAETIWVGVRCYDSDPGAIRATQRQRDANLDPDDRVELWFDTFADQRNAFWFQLGAAGSMGDALITRAGSSFNKQWDGIWLGRTSIDERGWVAEFAIPTQTLNFAPQGTAWGFNLRRLIRRRNEEARWASPDNRFRFFNINAGGRITGISGLEQGLGLDVVPYAKGVHDWDELAQDSDTQGDFGLDAFYRFTSSTKLSLSYNTDFAETEVDERRINLTRFPLFFPEKRAFFLEDSGNFFFGSTLDGSGNSGNAQPYFSRRIGIDADGNPVPILLAGKLTGQTEHQSYGVLSAQMDPTAELEGRNLFVGRFSQNFGENSDAGVILTNGNPTESQDSQTYGVDLNLRTDYFLGNRSLRASAYAVRSDNQGVDGDDTAWFAGISYPQDEFSARLTYERVGEDFDPRLGFVRRAGIQEWRGRVSYNPWINRGMLRRLFFMLRPSYISDTDGNLESIDIVAEFLGIELDSGDSLSLRAIRRTEVLTEDFEIIDDVFIAPGRYDFDRGSAELRTSPHRPIDVQLEASGGGYYDGRRLDLELDLGWRPGPWGNFGTELERNMVDLPSGAFDVNLARVRARFMFSPDLSWSNYVQYDDVSDGVGLNSRLWYIFRPGQELFFVVNQAWEASQDSFVSLKGDVTLKVGYTLRF